MLLRWVSIGITLTIACCFSAQAQIRSIGVAGDGEFTRITLASDYALDAEIYLAETADGRTIEVVPQSFSLSSDPYFGEPTGGIAAYLIDHGRISFELDHPMMVSRQLSLPPTGSDPRHRLIVDLARASATRFSRVAAGDARRLNRLQSSGDNGFLDLVSVEDDTDADPVRTFTDVLAEVAKTRRHKIAIDPGHGGKDPGAPIVSGGSEKSIVLDTSLKLKALLESDPRYDVLLTRENDIYVEHEDRVSIAREWGADLFISIHADAAAKPDVAGASVYTISTRGERRIEGTADKYGWHIPLEDGGSDEVNGILTDLVKRETKSNSAIFAEDLLPELAKAGPLVRNSHRQGNLFVLLAPDVPAVLVEIGFLSNKSDARRLKSKQGRRKSAEAIKQAIDTYFNRQDLKLASN